MYCITICYKKIMVFFFIIISFGLMGCAQQNPYGNTYTTSDTRTIQTVTTGTIVKLEPVTINADGSSTSGIIGTIAGGAIGALLGSKIGGGLGSDIAAIGGGVAGAAIGSKVTGAINEREGVNIVIRLDRGQTISIVQEVNPNALFTVGQRVDIYQSGNSARVVPAN